MAIIRQVGKGGLNMPFKKIKPSLCHSGQPEPGWEALGRAEVTP